MTPTPPQIIIPALDDTPRWLVSRLDLTILTNPFASPNEINEIRRNLVGIEKHDIAIRNAVLNELDAQIRQTYSLGAVMNVIDIIDWIDDLRTPQEQS